MSVIVDPFKLYEQNEHFLWTKQLLNCTNEKRYDKFYGDAKRL